MSNEQGISNNATTSGGEMNLIKRVIGIFTSPGQVFEAVRNKPNWLAPTLLIIAIALASVFVLKPIITKEQMARQQEMMEKRGMSEEQVEMAAEQGQKWMSYTLYPSVIIWTFVSFLIGAAVWLFVSKTILGGGAKYVQMLAVTAYTTLIDTVGGLIKMPIMLSKETVNVHFSIATFMSEGAKETFLYKLLSKVELFNIWSIAVLCIGIAVINRLKVNKVWPWVAVIYLLWFVITAAVGGMFGM
jgi:hypothetical protein